MSTSPLSNEEVASWYEGRTFSEDWTSWHFQTWAQVLSSMRSMRTNVLEIGSWEGRSALFFLNYLRHSQIVCVDTFAGGEEHRNDPKWATLIPAIEQRFDANLAPFKSRMEKIKATSSNALANLGVARRRFDLVYIDGSHQAKDVYADAVLTWSLLNRKGYLIFDDYEWLEAPDEYSRPKLGIDAFLWAMISQYAIIFRGYQLILQKL
jgi:hypothetical protein